MRRSVLNELENNGLILDEERAMKLLKYYQLTGLVEKEIQRAIDLNEFNEEKMRNVLQFKDLP